MNISDGSDAPIEDEPTDRAGTGGTDRAGTGGTDRSGTGSTDIGVAGGMGAGRAHTESRYDGLRRRGPLTWLVAAAAVLLIAGGSVLAVLRAGESGGPGGAGDTPVAGPAGSPRTTATTTALTAPPARGTARCLPPSARTLRGQEIALDATATEVTDRKVTLAPNRFYAGAPSDVVVVRAAPAELSALVGAVRFRRGERYLVSASDGEVSVCGLSAPWSQPLAALYAEAFGS